MCQCHVFVHERSTQGTRGCVLRHPPARHTSGHPRSSRETARDCCVHNFRSGLIMYDVLAVLTGGPWIPPRAFLVVVVVVVVVVVL